MRGRYGEEVLRTPYGRFYWSEALQDINYVPNGFKASRQHWCLQVSKNTVEDAVIKACAEAAKMLKVSR